MPADPHPQHGLARRDPGGTALMRMRDGDGMAHGLPFCASPTVLEAINHVLYQRGMPTLSVLPDGTIGTTDPLTFRVDYAPSPFVL